MIKRRVDRSGRELSPDELLKPGAVRPESRDRGLHATVTPAEPWRFGVPVPRDGAMQGVATMLLWFRIADRPIEGTPHWDRSASIIAPALTQALLSLRADDQLLVSDSDRKLVNPDSRALCRFLRGHFDYSFHAYIGNSPDLKRSRYTDHMDAFVRGRFQDLERWSIVADECYDAGGLELWSRRYSVEQLRELINLKSINSLLSQVDLDAAGRVR